MKNASQQNIVFGLLLLGAGLFQVKADLPSAPQGIITAKVYTNIVGGTLADLTGDPKFTSDSPDVLKWLPYFELWATGTNSITPPADSGDNYGAKISGLFWPSVTKNYIFTLCADDVAELYLSTDSNPANKKLIARDPGVSVARDYTTGAPSKLSSLFGEFSRWPVYPTKYDNFLGAHSRYDQFQGGGPSWPPAGITTTGTVAFVSGVPFTTQTADDPLPAAAPGVVLGPGDASITLHLSTLGLTNVSANHTRAFTDGKPLTDVTIGAGSHEITEVSYDGGTNWIVLRDYDSGRAYGYSGWPDIVGQSGVAAATNCYNIPDLLMRIRLIGIGSTKVYIDNVQIAGTPLTSASEDFQGTFPPAGVTTSGTVTLTSGAPFTTQTTGDPIPAASPGVVLGPGDASITLLFSTLGLFNVSANHTRAFCSGDPLTDATIGAGSHEITEVSPDGGTTWYLIRDYDSGRVYDYGNWGTVVAQSGDPAAASCDNIPELLVRISLIATDGSTKVYLDNVQIAGTTTSANPTSYDFHGVGFQFPPAGVTTSGTVTFTSGAPFDTVVPGGETMPNTSPGVVLGPGNASITLHLSTRGLTNVSVNHDRAFTSGDPLSSTTIGAGSHEITEVSPDGGTSWFLIRDYDTGRSWGYGGWGTVVDQSGNPAAAICDNIPDLLMRIRLIGTDGSTKSYIDNVQIAGTANGLAPNLQVQDFQGGTWPPPGVTISGTVTLTNSTAFTNHVGVLDYGAVPQNYLEDLWPAATPGVVVGPGNASITMHFSTLGLTDVHVNHTRAFTDQEYPVGVPNGAGVPDGFHAITEASPDNGATWYLVRNYTGTRTYDWSGWWTIVEQSAEPLATNCYNVPDLLVRISVLAPEGDTTPLRYWIDNVQVTGSPMEIYLAKEKPYYIEALMKESDTADNLSVSIDGVAPIPGSFLSTLSSLVIEKQANSVVITWTDGGVLQVSENVAGSYIDVPGNPASPATNAITGNTRFFKLRPN